MRITAGTYRSRKLETLEGDKTRPTLDKIKEAVFSRIGPYFETGMMLDLFSGSGAIGLESISRGFEKAVMVDNNYKAINIIKKNVNSLKANEYCEILNIDYKKAIEYCVKKGYKFDLIYLDPPYHLQLINELISLIIENDLLKENGDIVCESLLDEEITNQTPFEIVKQVNYGIVKVTYFRKV